jgi:diadenosine tetraphosphate (Ap4A) HIT family hydrolase
VLIAPVRVVARFRDMRSEEVADLWQLAQAVAAALEAHYAADSMSLVIQVQLHSAVGTGAAAIVPLALCKQSFAMPGVIS